MHMKSIITRIVPAVQGDINTPRVRTRKSKSLEIHCPPTRRFISPSSTSANIIGAGLVLVYTAHYCVGGAGQQTTPHHVTLICVQIRQSKRCGVYGFSRHTHTIVFPFCENSSVRYKALESSKW